MWYLVNKSNGEQTPCLLCNRVYKIGRLQATASQNPDIPLAGDSSVSRHHADLLLKFTESQCTNLDTKPNVILTDHSKFGTNVNDSKVNEFRSLNPNDLIRFGQLNCYFHLRQTPLIVTTSCVNTSNKKIIKQIVCQLGGHLVNDWHNECNFVVMDRITITVKVIGALINQKSIVTKKYFEDLVACSRDLEKISPDVAKYLPPLAEEDLEDVTFEPVAKRKKLFELKTFVFFERSQQIKMQNLIELASGQCMLFNKTRHLSLKFLRDNEDFIFMTSDDENERDNETKLSSLLGSLKRRLVDQTEIGLAVLFASIDKHCCQFMAEEEEPKKPISTCYKIGSQTLTHSRFEQTCINSNTQYNDLVLAAFETQDTAPFQYERDQINDTIPDTPEKRPKRLPFKEFQKPQDESSTPKQLIKVIDTPEKKRPNLRLPESNSKRTKLALEDPRGSSHENKLPVKIELTPENDKPSYKSYKSSSKDTRFPLEDTLASLRKKRSKPMETDDTYKSDSLVSINSCSFQENEVKKPSQKTAAITEKLITVKEEPTMTSTVPLMTYKKSKGLVMSKVKSENCLRSEVMDTESHMSQLKVRFESLVKKEPQNLSLQGDETGKKNFKKFIKVQKKLKTNASKENSKFKSFKNEPFDVNSQFDSFMNSMA